MLDRVVRTLTDNPELRVEVAGHTDDRGTEEYNLDLSMRRAESVRDYLVDHGIDGGRLVAQGYGRSQPLADTDTAENRRLNRRVELSALE